MPEDGPVPVNTKVFEEAVLPMPPNTTNLPKEEEEEEEADWWLFVCAITNRHLPVGLVPASSTSLHNKLSESNSHVSSKVSLFRQSVT